MRPAAASSAVLPTGGLHITRHLVADKRVLSRHDVRAGPDSHGNLATAIQPHSHRARIVCCWSRSSPQRAMPSGSRHKGVWLFCPEQWCKWCSSNRSDPWVSWAPVVKMYRCCGGVVLKVPRACCGCSYAETTARRAEAPRAACAGRDVVSSV